MQRLVRRLPEPAKEVLSRLYRPAARVWYGGTRHYCPLCRAHLRTLLPHGLEGRPKARCPVCGSLERHRMLWLYLARRTSLFDGQPRRMLHLAPERALRQKLAGTRNLHHVTADLRSPQAMLRLDVTALPHRDGAFDVICCSHVLEHVEDDRRAMGELHRVLRASGWAMIVVPITAVSTLENPAVSDPIERTRLFGHHDHVRRYGPDCRGRLQEAGFTVTTYHALDLADEPELTRQVLRHDEVIYHCTR